MEYREIVKSIVFLVDFVNDSWEYRLDIYKNKDGLYSPTLMKNEVFDLSLTKDQVTVSESLWINDGYTFGVEDNLFETVDECINKTIAVIQEHEKKVIEWSL